MTAAVFRVVGRGVGEGLRLVGREAQVGWQAPERDTGDHEGDDFELRSAVGAEQRVKLGDLADELGPGEPTPAAPDLAGIRSRIASAVLLATLARGGVAGATLDCAAQYTGSVAATGLEAPSWSLGGVGYAWYARVP